VYYEDKRIRLGAAPMKKLLFIFNPRSGKGQIKNKLMQIIDIFIKAGYEVEVHVTQCTLDAKEVVLKKGNQVDVIACSGGDGTLNEIVSGMMGLSKKPLLGYIPTGTTNDFAASLKISKDLVTAAKKLTEGTPFSCDIGQFNDKYFAYVAAFGLFTELPYVTAQEVKNILGYQAYILEGMKRLPNIKPYHMRVEANGEQIEEDFVYGMVSNTTRVAGLKGLCDKDAKMDDGIFEVMLVKMPKNPLEVGDIASGILFKDAKSEYIYRIKADSLRIISSIPVDWVLDGEFGGSNTEIVINNIQQAISILI